MCKYFDFTVNKNNSNNELVYGVEKVPGLLIIQKLPNL